MAHVRQHQHEVFSRRNGIAERETRTVVDEDDAVAVSEPVTNLVTRIIYIVTTVVIALLMMRFVLSLLGANRGNAFADLIYSTSQPLVAPFFGLFNYQAQYGVARFEFETLIAAAVYGLLSWLLISIINIGSSQADV